MKKKFNRGCSFHAGTPESWRRKLLPLLIAGCFGYSPFCAVWANPADAQVINGAVTFSRQDNLLSITNSPGSIINWQNFSINPGEITRFIQQNASSSVLNRVVGQNPSQILGALQSNGRVYLINPNGIVFGQGAQINVNGLVASTLNLNNDDFLAGRHTFTAGNRAGDIQNQGVITTPGRGLVYLIAPNVENTGIITSPEGNVLLAAGHSVQLVDAANPDLHVVVSAPENTAVNVGQIIAESGKTGIYGALVRQRGVVSANSAVMGENGKIVFKASKDTILDNGSHTTATGAGTGTGGSIHILGERVALAGNATVNASGQAGGGTVLIGGDYHGDNPAVHNAKRTYVGREAVIKADAVQQGDGGKVIVWADEATHVAGRVSARGGEQSGNGGFVETSGKQHLDYHAQVDVSAPAGKGGTLLLDPGTITLVGGTGDGSSTSDGTTLFQGSSIPGMFTFADNDLTSFGVSNIYQSELEGMYPGTTIILEAEDYIGTAGSFGNRVTLPVNSSLVMKTRNASTDDGTGLLGINLAGSMDGSSLEFKTQGTGTITLQAGAGAFPQFASVAAGRLTTEGGQVIVKATGNVMLDGITTTPSLAGVGGDILISASDGTLSLGGGGIDARGTMNGSGNVALASADTISMPNTRTIYADQLILKSANGIHGSTGMDALNTQVNALNALNTGYGDIRIHNEGAGLVINDPGYKGYGIKQVMGGQGIYVSTAVGQSITLNSQILTNGGSVNLHGSAGITHAPYNLIASKGGEINLYATEPGAHISLPFQSLISSSDGMITLKADKMALGGKVNAGGGIARLLPGTSTAIHLGTGNADTTGGTLELSGAELNNVTANVVRIGDDMSGAIDIKSELNGEAGGAMEFISSALNLTSGGAITQQANATISGIPALTVKGQSVTLTEANPTGVISGESTNGDFQYRSANQLTINSVDNVNGLTAPSTATIRLVSDSAQGINQIPGNAINTDGGGLVLQTGGPVWLADGSNTIGKLSAELDPGNAGLGELDLFSASDLDITSAGFGVSGITTNNQDIMLRTGSGKSLTVNQPINAGAGRVELAADTLTFNNAVTGTLVDIHPATSGRDVTVGAAVCASEPCLNVTRLYQVVAPTIGIGNDETYQQAGDIHVAGITDSNSNALTDIKHGVTTRIGLLTGGDITQGGTITVQDLGVSAGGAVNLDLDNSVTNFVGETEGNLNFVNATGFSLTTMSDGMTLPYYTGTLPPFSYSLTGIFTPGGNVSLTSRTGDIALNAPLYAGTGAISITAETGAITQSSGSITGASLTAAAHNGIGGTGSLSQALMTQVDLLKVTNSGTDTDIAIVNMGPLLLQSAMQSLPGSSGNITVHTNGALTVASAADKAAAVSTSTGTITLKTYSELIVDGPIHSSGGAIVLEAGAAAYAGTTAGNVVGTTMGTNTGTMTGTTNGSTQGILPGGTSLLGTGPSSYASYTSTPLFTSSGTTADIILNAPIHAGTGSVTLTATNGAISQHSGSITAASLKASASEGIGGIDSAGTSVGLLTEVGALTATNTGVDTDISIVNTGALALHDVQQSASGSSGNIMIANRGGALSVASGKTVATDTGAISLQSDSSLTVDGAVICSSGGAVTLEAGVTGSLTDTLTINGAVGTSGGTGTAVATTGNILLRAGDAITINGSVSGNVVQQANINPENSSTVKPAEPTPTPTPTPTSPTLSQCLATPSLEGCSAVQPLQALEPESPVAQALNSTVTAINTTTTTTTSTVAPRAAPPVSESSPAGGAAETVATPVESDKNGTSDKNDPASDEKKEAKKETTGTQDSGAKKNDVAKKMYCN